MEHNPPIRPEQHGLSQPNKTHIFVTHKRIAESRHILPDETRLRLEVLTVPRKAAPTSEGYFERQANEHDADNPPPTLPTDAKQAGKELKAINDGSDRRFLNALVAARGPLFALRALIHSCRSVPQPKYGDPAINARTLHLRPLLDRCTPDEQQELRRFALAYETPTPSQRIVLAALLPAEPVLLRRAFDGKDGGLFGRLWPLLLPVVQSAEDLHRLAPFVDWHRAATTMTALLVELGLPIAEEIALGFAQALRDRHQQREDKDGLIAVLLLAIPSDIALQSIVEHLHLTSYFQAAVKATWFYPVRLLRMLAPVAGKKGRGATWKDKRDRALLLMDGAVQAHPGALHLAHKSWPSPMLQRLPCRFRFPQACDPEAPSQDRKIARGWPLALPPLEVHHTTNKQQTPAQDTLLALLSNPDRARREADCDALRELVTSESLGRFSWALFESWHLLGQPEGTFWAFEQIALLGDDRCAENLALLLKNYSYSDRNEVPTREAVTLLASMKTKAALLFLSDVHLNGRRAPPRYTALSALQGIAKEQGTTKCQVVLAQTLPGICVTAGPIELDYGPRAFWLSLGDEHRPTITDSQGLELLALPKSNKKDDPLKVELARERHRVFVEYHHRIMQILAKTLKQLRNERWTPANFIRLIVKHPLLTPVLPWILWGQSSEDTPPKAGSIWAKLGDAPLERSFRISSGGFVDHHDDDLQLGNGPISLLRWNQLTTGHQHAWRQQLLDYEIVQPFDQMPPED